MFTLIRALLVRGRKLCLLVITLSALFGGGALLAPATHAQPQRPLYVECSSTKVVAMGSTSNSQGTIWVYLEKLVDARTLSWCGSLRVHAQTRGSFPSGYKVFGLIDYGDQFNHLTHSAYTPTKPVTYPYTDQPGLWQPGSCGQVKTTVLDGNGNSVGDSGFYPYIYGECV